MHFTQISYKDLNARQQETYNFHKVAAVLADYGFTCIRLSDDWQGADFIAQHIDGETFLKVQLKGRLTFDAKYTGKGLWVCFIHGDQVFLYPHDEALERFSQAERITHTVAWQQNGQYHFPHLGNKVLELIQDYRIQSVRTFG